MFSASPVCDSLSTFTPRTTSICNAVTPGDFRYMMKKPIMIIPEYHEYDDEQDDDYESENEYGLTHSVSRMSLSSSDEDVDVDVDDDDVMSTSTSPSTSGSNTPVSSPTLSSCASPRSIPAPKLPSSPCQQPIVAPISRPWSGCLSCDHPHWGRPCTQSHLLDLAIESCRTPSPVVIEHICTASCRHHRAHIHYETPAFLKKMTLNPAGFIRIALPETEQDMESTQLGHRKLGEKYITPRAVHDTPVTTRRTSITMTIAGTPIPVVTPVSAVTETPVTKPRFTFQTAESTTPAPTTQPNETPRLPRRSSLTSPLNSSVLTPPSQSFVPTLPAVPSTTSSPQSHALSLTELDISIEVPTICMSPIMYASCSSLQTMTRPIHRTASTMALVQQEEGRVMMSPPLPSSAMIPTWHNKTKHQQPYHLVLPPVSRKYHGVIPSSSTSCVSSMPRTWTQPKLMLLYVCYLFLNAVFVLVLHH